MLSFHEHQTLEDAGKDLLTFILEPENWVSLAELQRAPDKRPGKNPDYQCQVGKLRICASVDVTQTLDVFLRIAFRSPGLSPIRAADHLENFLKSRIPLTPNSEWHVRVDGREWIHFIRRYQNRALEG